MVYISEIHDSRGSTKENETYENVSLVIPNNSVIETYGICNSGTDAMLVKIHILEQIGSGTFGRVYRANWNRSRQPMALKQVCRNPNFSHREPEIMDQLEDHCNIVQLAMHATVELGSPSKQYTLLLMEYMPMTLLEFITRHHNHLPKPHGIFYVRILSYQLFRGLAHMHSLGICHRDIKPENLLMDHCTMVLKLSDFGSSKMLLPQEPNMCYICSHLYRAPELFAKFEHYTFSVDIWSAGCVVAEMLKGTPIFKGCPPNMSQLDYIVKVLGTEGLNESPQILARCGDVMSFSPQRPSFSTMLDVSVPSDLEDLLNSCLAYKASTRILPMMALAHPAHDELRVMESLNLKMPNGKPMPPLFNFYNQELAVDPKLLVQLLPLYLQEILPPENEDVVVVEFN